VWFEAIADSLTCVPSYVIVLFYPEQGIVAKFEGDAEKFGEALIICPQLAQKHPTLWLFSPDQQITFEEEFYDEFVGAPPYGYPIFLLEEVSNINTETLYKTYTDSNAASCFESPIDLWP